MHVSDDPVDLRPLRLDVLASPRVFGAPGVALGAGAIAVTLRLEARGELVLPDRASDEPDEPGERVALFGGVDVDAQRRAVFVDELEDLGNGPAPLDEPFPCDDAAHLADVATADPLEIGPPVGEPHTDAPGCAASCPEEAGEPTDQLGGEALDSGLPAGQGTAQIEHFIQSSTARSAGRVRACAPWQGSLNR